MIKNRLEFPALLKFYRQFISEKKKNYLNAFAYFKDF